MSEEDQFQISKKRKFIADGVFRAEIHQFFTRALVGAGYSGLTVKQVGKKLQIRVKVVNKIAALGPNGQRGNEFEALIQKRFGFPDNHIQIIFELNRNKAISAAAQVEYLKAKLIQKAPVRSAAMFIIRSVMRNNDVKGCEVIISGKLRQQRAKVMKYKGGYLISTGEPKRNYIDHAIRYIGFPQGIMGL